MCAKFTLVDTVVHSTFATCSSSHIHRQSTLATKGDVNAFPYPYLLTIYFLSSAGIPSVHLVF